MNTIIAEEALEALKPLVEAAAKEQFKAFPALPVPQEPKTLRWAADVDKIYVVVDETEENHFLDVLLADTRALEAMSQSDKEAFRELVWPQTTALYRLAARYEQLLDLL